MRIFIIILLLLPLLFTGFQGSSAIAADDVRVIMSVDRSNYDLISNMINEAGGKVNFAYKYVDAIAATLPTDKVNAFNVLPEVKRIEKDVMVSLPEPREHYRPGLGMIAGVVELGADNIQAMTVNELKSLLDNEPNNYSPYTNNLTNALKFSQMTGHYGENVIVAIIDAGVSSAARAVNSRIVGAENFSGDGIPGDSPLNGSHGTWVACCVGANAIFGFSNPAIQNAVKQYAPNSVLPDYFGGGIDGIPMVGQAPQALFYSLKVFPYNSGSAPRSVIGAAFERAVELKQMYNEGDPDGVNIRIVNMSLGGPELFAGNDPIYSPLVKMAHEAGIVVVTSAGNNGPSSMTIGDPGDSKNILTVGATSDAVHERIVAQIFYVPSIPNGGFLWRPIDNNQVADYSSRGPNADGRSDPDIVAPGTWRYAQSANGSTISWVSGTSFSAPTVAGAAALLISAYPNATPDQIRAALLNGANPWAVDGRPGKQDQGFGFLDVARAYARFGSWNPWDIGLQTPLVRINVALSGIRVIDSDNFSGSTGWLLPGQRKEFVIQTTTQPLTGMTVSVNVTPMLSPSQQNQLFGDDAYIGIASAKTSTGDYRAGTPAFVKSTQTFELSEQDLELGLTRITIQGDWTNAGLIKADVQITKNTSLPGLFPVGNGKLAEGQNAVYTVDVPEDLPQAKFTLGWLRGWEAWPTNDLDLYVIDPQGNMIIEDNDGDGDPDGLSLDDPERVIVQSPMPGTWTLIVDGYTVWNSSADYILFSNVTMPFLPKTDAEVASAVLSQIPDKFALSQNYPNPFNPTTSIKYQLPEQSHVSLQIYNIQGQLVRTITDGVEEAGYYTANWDGRNDASTMMPSGTYIYVIKTEKFTQAHKMILLK
ncbi:MAG: S8 family serine peptidase [Calditrichia bacterium]